MSDKQNIQWNQFPSKFKIGENIYLFFPKSNVKIEAYIRAVIFSNAKIRYSLYLKDEQTTIHNVDSIFVIPKNQNEIIDFETDNYS